MVAQTEYSEFRNFGISLYDAYEVGEKKGFSQNRPNVVGAASIFHTLTSTGPSKNRPIILT